MTPAPGTRVNAEPGTWTKEEAVRLMDEDPAELGGCGDALRSTDAGARLLRVVQAAEEWTRHHPMAEAADYYRRLVRGGER